MSSSVSRIAIAILLSNRKASSDGAGRLEVLLAYKPRPSCPKMGCAPLQQQEKVAASPPVESSLPGAGNGGLACSVLHTQMV